MVTTLGYNLFNVNKEGNKMSNEKGQCERTMEAMTKVIDTTNAMNGEKEMAQGMFLALTSSHRTLQQSFFRVFVAAMGEYAEAHHDLRNEASVDFAKRVVALEHHFPFV